MRPRGGYWGWLVVTLVTACRTSTFEHERRQPDEEHARKSHKPTHANIVVTTSKSAGGSIVGVGNVGRGQTRSFLVEPGTYQVLCHVTNPSIQRVTVGCRHTVDRMQRHGRLATARTTVPARRTHAPGLPAARAPAEGRRQVARRDRDDQGTDRGDETATTF
jgi:hypothetical protein